jgi:hypothetical protein
MLEQREQKILRQKQEIKRLTSQLYNCIKENIRLKEQIKQLQPSKHEQT